MYIVSLALWPFTALPDPHQMTSVYLTIIHLFLGVSIAGIVVSSMNIVFTLAPQKEATSYLAVNGTLVSIVSAIAPIIGGLISHYLEYWEFQTTLKSKLPEAGDVVLHLVDIRGLEYLFVISIIFGMYALERLSFVQEGREVPGEVIYQEFFRETRRALRNLSTATGIFYLMNIPSFLTQRRKENAQATEISGQGQENKGNNAYSIKG